MRTINRILAALLALGLLFGGVLVAIEIALGLAGKDPWLIPWDTWYRDARQHDWAATSVRWLLAAIGTAGVVLLALQLVPRRPATLAFGSDSDADIVVRRKSLESALARAATRVDGIDRASTQVGKTVVGVRARSRRRDPGDLATVVENTVRRAHNTVQPNHARDVRVHLNYRKHR